MPPWSRSAVAVVVVGLVATGCTLGGQSSDGTTSAQPPRTPSPAPTLAAPSPTSSAPLPTAPTAPPSTQSASPTPTLSPAAACASQLVHDLSTARQAGQLLWVGLDVNARPSSLKSLVSSRHLGGVVLLGGWTDGSSTARSATSTLQSYATTAATGGIRLFISADQEGGQVQQLRGDGFTRIPSARTQDGNTPAELRRLAATWAKELAAVGINVNLAPVADTVPASLGTGNGPIGRYGRQFSSDPENNARMVAGFIEGMHDGGVAATVKHFPGLGRVRSNTDFSATGITDRTTTTTDAYLKPFVSGLRADVDFVMMSSATYTQIDPTTQAVFSPKVISGLLREQLGYAGVVVTDDVGAAKAVSAVPVGARATMFIEAGGDIVLTAKPSTVAPMIDAIVARAGKNPAFAATVQAAALRVLTLKVERGLAQCR